MYKELVKRLWECASGDCFNCSQPNLDLSRRTCADKLMKQAADAIEKLSKPQWIPVTERMPEQDGQVVAVNTINTIPPIKRIIVVSFAKSLFEIDRYEFKNKPGFYSYDSEYGYFERIGITHWMPLPDPPKEGE